MHRNIGLIDENINDLRGQRNFNKNEIFKPINEDELKFVSKPTIRLKRTPIGVVKPQMEIPMVHEKTNFSLQHPKYIVFPIGHQQNDSLIEKKNKELMREIEELKVFLIKMFKNR